MDFENLSVGNWIRFYTNSTRPNLSHLGPIARVKRCKDGMITGYVTHNPYTQFVCDVSVSDIVDAWESEADVMKACGIVR